MKSDSTGRIIQTLHPICRHIRVQEYLDYEIIPGLTHMRNAGLNPVDFAYPGGSDDPAATQALQAYFGHIRGHMTPGTIRYITAMVQTSTVISGIGIDEYLWTVDRQYL